MAKTNVCGILRMAKQLETTRVILSQTQLGQSFLPSDGVEDEFNLGFAIPVEIRYSQRGVARLYIVFFRKSYASQEPVEPLYLTWDSKLHVSEDSILTDMSLFLHMD